MGLFAAGWDEHQVIENYPTLTPEALRAVFAFAAGCLSEGALCLLSGERRDPPRLLAEGDSI